MNGIPLAPERGFGAAMCAAHARTPGRRGRGAGVVLSTVGHIGVLGFMAWLSGIKPTTVAPPPDPVLVHLAQPRVPAVPNSSQPAAVRRPRPQRLVQPPPVVALPQPDPDEPELEPEAAAVDDSVAVADAVAGPPGPAVSGVGQGDQALELRQVARRPAVLHQVTPEYPADARWRRLEGVVIVRVIVSATGAVEPDSVQVMKSVPALDHAATAAIKAWRFSPALGPTGRPVRVIIEVPFDFSLH